MDVWLDKAMLPVQSQRENSGPLPVDVLKSRSL